MSINLEVQIDDLFLKNILNNQLRVMQTSGVFATRPCALAMDNVSSGSSVF
jgi:hypothetical protein